MIDSAARAAGGAASVVVGVGARRGVAAAEIDELIEAALAKSGVPATAVVTLVTLDARAREPGLQMVASRRGWPLVGLPARALASVAVPHHCDRVRAAVGTGSVAEAAALLVAGAHGRRVELLLGKQVGAAATVAVARAI